MILWINGSINSGKSTVARILQERLANTANVEIDTFHEFIAWKPIQECVQLNIRNAVSVMRNFLAEGIDVIATYPLSQRNYDFVLGELQEDKAHLQVITLAPPLEEALRKRGERDLNDWEIKRIQHHYEIGITAPKFGYIIDNSDQTPDETADEILKHIKLPTRPEE